MFVVKVNSFIQQITPCKFRFYILCKMIKLKHFITIFDGLDIIMVICYLKKARGVSVFYCSVKRVAIHLSPT